MSKKKPIINAHIHVFTGNFVPPYLARSFVPWPFYRLLNLNWVVAWFRRYYNRKYRHDYARINASESKEVRDQLYKELYDKRSKAKRKVFRMQYIRDRWYLLWPLRIVQAWLILVATLLFINWVIPVANPGEKWMARIDSFESFLAGYKLYYSMHPILQIIWVFGVLLFVQWSRKVMYLIISLIWSFLKKIPGKQSIALAKRYLSIGRFAFYKTQRGVAYRALHQLPDGSRAVILPMDMEYMGAGKTPVNKQLLNTKAKNLLKGWTQEDYQDVYKYQMRELWQLCKNDVQDEAKREFYPFVFIDPRRIEEEGDSFFNYRFENGKIVLDSCFVKTYIEDRRFAGFKIYPALGYYPFDTRLLPLWLYAAQNNIPVMTHCVKGVIYYRGKKKKKWNEHPVFKQASAKGEFAPLLLGQAKNVDFQVNFTHPMNYLCLVDEELLRKLISDTQTADPLRRIFGYTNEDTPLERDLSALKVCLAHFGGEEEWLNYLDQDRNTYSQRLIQDPLEAIQFTKNRAGDFSWDKLHQLWQGTDWYSIICSMLINYDQIYADISYIISKESTYPLLRNTLEKGADYEKQKKEVEKEPDVLRKARLWKGKNKLRKRVLFGTDFYVVRNHNADKDLYVAIRSALGEDDFDLIARDNTHEYLLRN